MAAVAVLAAPTQRVKGAAGVGIWQDPVHPGLNVSRYLVTVFLWRNSLAATLGLIYQDIVLGILQARMWIT